MKEIKFRGKVLGDGYNFRAGEFAYGSLVFEGDEPYIVGPVVEANEDYIAHEWWVPVDPATVGQYTGLKDKHGREIYDGDICNCREYECYGKVAWNDDEAGFYFCISYEDGTFEEERLYDYADALEIIGNIHDNPELLDVDMSNEIEHDYTDEIVCPWCGYRHSDSWEVVDGLQECENCEKSFYVERNIEVTYSTQKANYGTCKHCGKENVPIENWHSIIAGYESLCPDCGAKEWIRYSDEYSKGLDKKGAM